MPEQEAGGTFLQEALVPWQVHCRQQVWSSQACGHISRPPDHHLKRLCYSCRCSWATAWKASVLPYGALGREPLLKMHVGLLLGKRLKNFAMRGEEDETPTWNLLLEICPGLSGCNFVQRTLGRPCLSTEVEWNDPLWSLSSMTHSVSLWFCDRPAAENCRQVLRITSDFQDEGCKRLLQHQKLNYHECESDRRSHLRGGWRRAKCFRSHTQKSVFHHPCRNPRDHGFCPFCRLQEWGLASGD